MAGIIARALLNTLLELELEVVISFVLNDEDDIVIEELLDSDEELDELSLLDDDALEELDSELVVISSVLELELSEDLELLD